MTQPASPELQPMSPVVAGMTDPAELREAVMSLLELARDFIDLDECWSDHHGYCQAHSWFETETPCPHARAKDALAEARMGVW